MNDEIKNRKRHEKVMYLIEIYSEKCLTGRNVDTIKKTYSEKYAQTSIGKFTLICSKMYESEIHIKTIVEELDSFVKGSL